MTSFLGRLTRSIDRRNKQAFRYEAELEVVGVSAWPKGITSCTVHLVRLAVTARGVQPGS